LPFYFRRIQNYNHLRTEPPTDDPTPSPTDDPTPSPTISFEPSVETADIPAVTTKRPTRRPTPHPVELHPIFSKSGKTKSAKSKSGKSGSKTSKSSKSAKAFGKQGKSGAKQGKSGGYYYRNALFHGGNRMSNGTSASVSYLNSASKYAPIGVEDESKSSGSSHGLGPCGSIVAAALLVISLSTL